MTKINLDKVKQVPTKPGVYFFKNDLAIEINESLF